MFTRDIHPLHCISKPQLKQLEARLIDLHQRSLTTTFVARYTLESPLFFGLISSSDLDLDYDVQSDYVQRLDALA